MEAARLSGHRARRTEARGRGRRLGRRQAAAVVLAVLALLGFGVARVAGPAPTGAQPGGRAEVAAPPARAPVPPEGLILVGAQLDWAVDSPQQYAARSGVRPAVIGVFESYPMAAATTRTLLQKAAVVKSAGATLFLTLEPHRGLDAVTPRTAEATAQVLARINTMGVPVYLRFGHEMNGSWYPWGQQPVRYRAAFRTLADAVHRLAPRTAMVWAPNYGGGYPFDDGSPLGLDPVDAAVLDTNDDGRITMDDDPYAPYYPGDDVVDWAGLSLYFFGLEHPWLDNDVPDDGRLAAQLTGQYDGSGGDERALPDFYDVYANQHHRPVTIAETGARFTAEKAGAGERDVKIAWIRQALDPALAHRFPRLAMVNWFEYRKAERDGMGVVDWRITTDPLLGQALRACLERSPSAFLRAPSSPSPAVPAPRSQP